MDKYNTHSENAEMYLVSMAILAESGTPCPIPIPRLAEEMGIQTVSANHMVRKLEEEGLVSYQPYKGVSFTDEGQKAVSLILRNRRLWEVFFVRQLNFTPSEADALACRMEHITQPEVASRLADFLDHPTTSPTGRLIPDLDEADYSPTGMPLTELQLAQQAEVLAINLGEEQTTFLRGENLVPGTLVDLLAHSSSGNVLIRIEGKTLTLTGELAEKIIITPDMESPNDR